MAACLEVDTYVGQLIPFITSRKLTNTLSGTLDNIQHAFRKYKFTMTFVNNLIFAFLHDWDDNCGLRKVHSSAVVKNK